jgi:hypothetical protein
VLIFLTTGALLAAIFAWFAILITGRYPPFSLQAQPGRESGRLTRRLGLQRFPRGFSFSGRAARFLLAFPQRVSGR